MRIIVTYLPTLDAALLRFDSWWSGLSRRERMLLSVLGLLLTGVVLIYGVVKPLQAGRAEAVADIRTYETLTARIRAAGTLSTTRPQRRQGSPAQVVSASASGFGLAIAPQAVPGGVRVTVVDGSYDSLLAWLADLSATSDLRVRGLSIQRRPAAGRVSATVEFVG